MQKGIILLGLSLLLTACDLGFPRMTVNYDNLPQGEIKEYITKRFPNEPEKEVLSKLIYAHLDGDNRADSIKKAVSQMGMTCEAGKEICSIQDILEQNLLNIAQEVVKQNAFIILLFHLKKEWIH